MAALSQIAASTEGRNVTNNLMNAAYGVPLGRTAVVVLTDGGYAGLAGHYDDPATAHRQAVRRGDQDDVRVFLVRNHRGGTTVYLDPHTVLETVSTRQISADNTRGSGGSDCCGGHRKKCRFGREHSWSVWYRNGSLVRSRDTWHCLTCEGVCTAEEPDSDWA